MQAVFCGLYDVLNTFYMRQTFFTWIAETKKENYSELSCKFFLPLLIKKILTKTALFN